MKRLKEDMEKVYGIFLREMEVLEFDLKRSLERVERSLFQLGFIKGYRIGSKHTKRKFSDMPEGRCWDCGDDLENEHNIYKEKGICHICAVKVYE